MMQRSLAISTATFLLLATLNLSAQSCAVRSGVDPVTGVATSGNTPFAAADFAAAAAGTLSSTVATFPGWATTFPCDPAASWISIPAGASGSGLLSVQFPCALPPCATATLNFCFAVDNDLGNTVNEGLFLNGVPIAGTRLLGGASSHFTGQNTFTALPVTGSLLAANNTLQIFVRNLGGPSAIRFSATLNIGPPAPSQPCCTVRSGVDPVTGVATSGSAAFVAADFAAAAAGSLSATVATFPGWTATFPCDPAANWINVPAGASGSGLLSVQFPCVIPPCSSATLDFCFAVDNDLGNTVNEGLFMNGAPIAGTKLLGGAATNFTGQHLFTGLPVTGIVHGGLNTLQIFVSNLGGTSGIRFSATLNIGAPTSSQLCTTGGPLPNVIPPMTGAVSADPFQRNDDGSSSAIPLGFNFCFYGQTFTDLYINNNGNVTFGSPLGAFTGIPFPSVGPKMLAPFWADVDTRNVNTGFVWYTWLSPTLFVVTWERVGYFSQHADKLNTFQLLISDGTDPIIGIGNNVCFCYDCMEWTTGDASLGVGGFGGSPAIAGINRGDGIDAMQVGRFDHAGSDYDGPLGNNDGVSWLDGRSLCFNVGTCCGQVGQVGLNNLAINGSFQGSSSGATINVPTGTTVTIDISAPPFSGVTLMYSLNCICPGIYTPYGELHLDPATLSPIIDGCGFFGTTSGAFTDASGMLTLSIPIPPAFAGLCVCVQAIICHPASFQFTQAYRVCFL